PRALENDEVEPADIDKLNQVNPYTAKLRENSEKRLKQDPDYKYIAEDIVRVKKQQADKSVSLNESERRKEAGENKARAEARKKERATRAKSGEKVFALDLKAARANGPLKLIKVRLPDILPNENTPNSEPPDSLLMDASLRETLRILDDYRRLLPGTPAISSNN
ncbi:MAG: carboxy terminal-processing peptidase, partial [Verrucomicrobiota bacterium]|nr:carboxy terminal-processing peptidase [Verrucomicrobiota bacterium]